MDTVVWETACGKALPLTERSFLKLVASLAEKAFEKPTIVNIGVFRCASMYCLRAGSPKARIIGIDIEKCTVPIQKGLEAEFVTGDSRVVVSAPMFKDPIHVLFIDGDHHYEVVKADIDNWAPKIAMGGFLVLHDCYPTPKSLRANPYIEGVNRAVSEWFAVNKNEWREDPATDSLRAFCLERRVFCKLRFTT